MSLKRWLPGDTVVFRYPLEDRMVRAYIASRGDTNVNVYGWAHIVLEDSEKRVALFAPSGTQTVRWNVAEQRFREPRMTLSHSVRLLFPGKPFEVSLYYAAPAGKDRWVDTYFPGVEGPFYGWKVDLTSPFGRSAAGFDCIDEVLDVVVPPDRSYYWKDMDEMAELIRLGIYTRGDAEAIRQTGREVIKLIDAGLPPFDDEWVQWQPPTFEPALLPDGWQHLPVPAPYHTYDGPLT